MFRAQPGEAGRSTRASCATWRSRWEICGWRDFASRWRRWRQSPDAVVAEHARWGLEQTGMIRLVLLLCVAAADSGAGCDRTTLVIGATTISTTWNTTKPSPIFQQAVAEHPDGPTCTTMSPRRWFSAKCIATARSKASWSRATIPSCGVPK